MTGRHTGLAARALVEIHDHAPAMRAHHSPPPYSAIGTLPGRAAKQNQTAVGFADLRQPDARRGPRQLPGRRLRHRREDAERIRAALARIAREGLVSLT